MIYHFCIHQIDAPSDGASDSQPGGAQHEEEQGGAADSSAHVGAYSGGGGGGVGTGNGQGNGGGGKGQGQGQHSSMSTISFNAADEAKQLEQRAGETAVVCITAYLLTHGGCRCACLRMQ